MKKKILRWYKRITSSALLALLSLVIMVTVVLAAPGLITDLSGTSTDTTITLRWDLASSSNSTLVRYSTTTYPVTTDNGTVAYNGTANYVELTELTSGSSYYFSAWGYDGSDFSASPIELVITTALTISSNTTPPIPTPTLPDMGALPSTGGWSLEPLTSIFAFFADPADAHGGLGMPTDNLISTIAACSIFFIGLGAYVKSRDLLGTIILAFVLTFIGVGIDIMQPVVLLVLLAVGLGVWAFGRGGI